MIRSLRLMSFDLILRETVKLQTPLQLLSDVPLVSCWQVSQCSWGRLLTAADVLRLRCHGSTERVRLDGATECWCWLC
jgi:hypothetical protein